MMYRDRQQLNVSISKDNFREADWNKKNVFDGIGQYRYCSQQKRQVYGRAVAVRPKEDPALLDRASIGSKVVADLPKIISIYLNENGKLRRTSYVVDLRTLKSLPDVIDDIKRLLAVSPEQFTGRWKLLDIGGFSVREPKELYYQLTSSFILTKLPVSARRVRTRALTQNQATYTAKLLPSQLAKRTPMPLRKPLSAPALADLSSSNIGGPIRLPSLVQNRPLSAEYQNLTSKPTLRNGYRQHILTKSSMGWVFGDSALKQAEKPISVPPSGPLQPFSLPRDKMRVRKKVGKNDWKESFSDCFKPVAKGGRGGGQSGKRLVAGTRAGSKPDDTEETPAVANGVAQLDESNGSAEGKGPQAATPSPKTSRKLRFIEQKPSAVANKSKNRSVSQPNIPSASRVIVVSSASIEKRGDARDRNSNGDKLKPSDVDLVDAAEPTAAFEETQVNEANTTAATKLSPLPPLPGASARASGRVDKSYYLSEDGTFSYTRKPAISQEAQRQPRPASTESERARRAVSVDAFREPTVQEVNSIIADGEDEDQVPMSIISVEASGLTSTVEDFKGGEFSDVEDGDDEYDDSGYADADRGDEIAKIDEDADGIISRVIDDAVGANSIEIGAEEVRDQDDQDVGQPALPIEVIESKIDPIDDGLLQSDTQDTVTSLVEIASVGSEAFAAEGERTAGDGNQKEVNKSTVLEEDSTLNAGGDIDVENVAEDSPSDAVDKGEPANEANEGTSELREEQTACSAEPVVLVADVISGLEQDTSGELVNVEDPEVLESECKEVMSEPGPAEISKADQNATDVADEAAESVRVQKRRDRLKSAKRPSRSVHVTWNSSVELFPSSPSAPPSELDEKVDTQDVPQDEGENGPRQNEKGREMVALDVTPEASSSATVQVRASEKRDVSDGVAENEVDLEEDVEQDNGEEKSKKPKSGRMFRDRRKAEERYVASSNSEGDQRGAGEEAKYVESDSELETLTTRERKKKSGKASNGVDEDSRSSEDVKDEDPRVEEKPPAESYQSTEIVTDGPEAASEEMQAESIGDQQEAESGDYLEAEAQTKKRNKRRNKIRKENISGDDVGLEATDPSAATASESANVATVVGVDDGQVENVAYETAAAAQEVESSKLDDPAVEQDANVEDSGDQLEAVDEDEGKGTVVENEADAEAGKKKKRRNRIRVEGISNEDEDPEVSDLISGNKSPSDEARVGTEEIAAEDVVGESNTDDSGGEQTGATGGVEESGVDLERKNKVRFNDSGSADEASEDAVVSAVADVVDGKSDRGMVDVSENANVDDSVVVMESLVASDLNGGDRGADQEATGADVDEAVVLQTENESGRRKKRRNRIRFEDTRGEDEDPEDSMLISNDKPTDSAAANELNDEQVDSNTGAIISAAEEQVLLGDEVTNVALFQDEPDVASDEPVDAETVCDQQEDGEDEKGDYTVLESEVGVKKGKERRERSRSGDFSNSAEYADSADVDVDGKSASGKVSTGVDEDEVVGIDGTVVDDKDIVELVPDGNSDSKTNEAATTGENWATDNGGGDQQEVRTGELESTSEPSERIRRRDEVYVAPALEVDEDVQDPDNEDTFLASVPSAEDDLSVEDSGANLDSAAGGDIGVGQDVDAVEGSVYPAADTADLENDAEAEETVDEADSAGADAGKSDEGVEAALKLASTPAAAEGYAVNGDGQRLSKDRVKQESISDMSDDEDEEESDEEYSDEESDDEEESEYSDEETPADELPEEPARADVPPSITVSKVNEDDDVQSEENDSGIPQSPPNDLDDSQNDASAGKIIGFADETQTVAFNDSEAVIVDT